LINSIQVTAIMASLQTHQLTRFSPFDEFPDNLLAKVLPNAREIRSKAGDTILRKNQQSRWAHYLISGTIEVRSSFFERFKFSHHDERSCYPLEDMAGKEAQITALDDCYIARFSLDELEEASQYTTKPDYQAQSLHSGDTMSGDYVVQDSSLEADWLSEFLHSPLVNHVSARDIQQLLACIDDIDYPAGAEIVGGGEYGDYFYIVKRGLATVHTDPNGPYRGKEFTLMPGGYFGEEALVGDTIRNARVSMETAGTLGQIDRESFNQFIRDALVVKAQAEKLKSIIDNPGEHNIILDVRLYPEYCHGHQEQSTNMPLAILRERLDQLDMSKHYYITPEGGPRSELATFLMRQAGFNTVLLQPKSKSC
jgi:CRP-like cAMP-binding protein